MFSLSLLAALTGYAVLASGLKLPLTRRNIHRSISARDDNRPVSDPNDPFNFQKIGGFYYSTTIHINGQPFEVDLDTGSSDLWIDTAGANLTGSIDIGIPASIGYEDLSSATGNLTLTDMKWGNYTVKDQIFINAPGSDATLGGLRDGVLGLGPASTSHIIQTVSFQNVSNTSYARTLTDNIFSQYPDKPSYITFLLSRGNNSDDVMDGGDFTIGETVKGHEDILTAPKLPIIHRTGRWISFIDGLTVNGELIKWTSVGLSKMLLPDPPQIPVPEGKFIATFDTGISYTILPRPVVEAIFKDIPIVKLNGMEYIDCSTKVNFSINIGNSEYPVHPLDLVVPILLDEDGTVKCRPGLSPTDSDLFGDFQFGDSVLRNLYTLFNFGNWTRPGDVQPYIQITSVTDKEKAWAEFDSMQDARI